MKKKWLLSLVLIFTLVLGIMPMNASAETIIASGTCGENLTWVLTEDGTLSISGEGAMDDYTFEDDGKTAPWEEYRYSVVTLTMSDGITSVGAYAFSECIYLINISLPNSLVSIGEYAFMAAGLRSGGVSNLVIPEGTTRIGSYAFTRSYLKSITFPSTLKKIEEGAFEWAGVENVYIPSMEAWCGIEFDSFFANPFEDTWSNHLYVNGKLVTDIVIPYGVTEIGVSQFSGYSSLTSVQIPDSVTRVGKYAFDMGPNGPGQDSKLTEIVFPASVEYIGARALGYQYNLEKIVILNPNCEIAEYMCVAEYELEDKTGPVIYGYAGSTAETYANEAGYQFVALKAYEITSGANSTVSAGTSLTVQVNADCSKLVSVAVDGLTVDPANYTVAEDNHVVTLNEDYLSTLTVGEHRMTLIFTDGVVETTFIVETGKNEETDPSETVPGETTPEETMPQESTAPEKDDTNPNTGVKNLLAPVMLLAALSLIGAHLIVAQVYKKKR